MEEHSNERGNSTTVTSVGNSWIVCKSKSRPGHNYYFNTVNGQTVWNLCDAELEKAQRNTRFLEDQPGNGFEHIPEPKDKPPTHNTSQAMNSPVHSNIYNKQIINNQFPKQQFTIQPIAPIGPFFNPINSFNMIPVPAPQTFNPVVWDQQPHQQFFVTPAVHPLTNQVQASFMSQTQPTLAFAFNNVQQSLAQQDMSVSRNIQSSRGIGKSRGKNWNGRYGHKMRLSGQKQFYNRNKKDLRQKLKTKCVYNKIVNMHNEEIDNAVEEPDNGDETTLNTLGIENYQEQITKIDMTPLRNLSPSNARLDCWYIVADTTVILRNFKYLNNLTDSDDTCHLMVPKHVMSQLRTIARNTENVHTRRIVRFLSQQIDSGHAFIADDSSCATGDMTTDILNTCIKLEQQNYHVVLISDNKELLEPQNGTRIAIYTIEELNRLLKRGTYKGANKKRLIPESMIKITVPNNQIANKMRNHDPLVDSECSAKENITAREAHISDIDRIKQITIVTMNPDSIDPIEETGICTEWPEQISNNNDKFDNVENKSSRLVKEFTAIDKNAPIHSNDPYNFESSGKTRIKLKRSTSNVIPLDNELTSERKRYKWRNRRNTTAVVTERSSIVAPYSEHQIQPDASLYDSAGNTNSENMTGEQSERFSCKTSKCVCDDNKSGSSFVINTNVNSEIVIEDSSTTEGSSRLESNNDTENTYGKVKAKPKFSFVMENKNNAIFKNVMFEITDKVMEEYLTMRRDEWVSRFVQIMEEVLTQVLQKDPPFESKDFPPPWTLHEATQCVIKKFSSCNYVVDAANKLSIVLSGISDSRGKITTNMKPAEFMEMYSFSVYLVQSLQDLSRDCEDLQTAADSLKRILIDIQNPNMDCGHNDTFTEGLPKPCEDVKKITCADEKTECPSPVNVSLKSKSSIHQETVDGSTSPNDNNLLSTELDQQEEIPQEENKKTFFSNLELQKTVAVCDSNESQGSTVIINNERTDENVADTMDNTHEPKVIRQFRKFSAFEERLRKREESYDDFEYESDENCDFTDDHYDEVTEAQFKYDNGYTENSVKTIETDVDDHRKLRYFIGKILKQVIDTFRETKIFCKKSIDVLRAPNQSKIMKLNIRRKAEKARTVIITLCQSLDSILKRDTDDPKNNIGVLIKKAGIDISVDQSLLAEYRDIVTTFKEQAIELQSFIKVLIIAA